MRLGLCACLVSFCALAGSLGAQSPFLRGDANLTGSHDVGDAITVLNALFAEGPRPCDDAIDTNDDGKMDIADGIFLLSYLFVDGPQPPPPFEACGTDPTGDPLGCASFAPDICPANGHASEVIGPAGGTLRLGRLALAVPPDLLPEALEITVTRLPSLAEEAREQLDANRFRPVGPAFSIQAPFSSEDPLSLSLTYDEGEIPAGFEAADLGILFRLEGYPEGPDMVHDAGAPPSVVFVPMPATVDEPTHEVRRALHGGGTVQLLAMAERLEREAVEVPPAPPPQKAAKAPFEIVWVTQPANKADFKAKILDALTKAFQVLVFGAGLPAPSATVTVNVAPVAYANAIAFVAPDQPLIIVIDPEKVVKVRSVVAHEYMHVIQSWNSNLASASGAAGDENMWFAEGTAEWAMDEVFDGIPGHYRAPGGDRFAEPLNKIAPMASPYHYRTVAFWKWLEANRPGAIRDIILAHASATHSSLSLSIKMMNTVAARYLDALLASSPRLDFLAFARSALYLKDFDADETGAGDLWDPQMLGPPRTVPAYFRGPGDGWVERLERGGAGDGKGRPASMAYMLASHLTAFVQVIASQPPPKDLTGVLYIEFDAADKAYDACVLSSDGGTSLMLRDLRSARKVAVPFRAGTEVAVITVEPIWQADPQSGAIEAGMFKAWVETDVTVLDFEHLRRDDDKWHRWGTTVSDDGYTFITLPNENNANWGFLTQGTQMIQFPGSTGILNQIVESETVMTRDGGGLFDLISMDLSENKPDSGVLFPRVTRFQGTRGDGTVVTTTIDVQDRDFGYTTFWFDGWTDLRELRWITFNTAGIYLDNIVLRSR